MEKKEHAIYSENLTISTMVTPFHLLKNAQNNFKKLIFNLTHF